MSEGPEELVTYLNGRLLPHSQALAEMSGAEFQSGGFYDAERTFGGRVFKLREHLQRLYRSLGAVPFGPGLRLEEMETATLKVVKANVPLLGTNDDFLLGQSVSPRVNDSSDANVAIQCQFIDFAAFAREELERNARIARSLTLAMRDKLTDLEEIKDDIEAWFEKVDTITEKTLPRGVSVKEFSPGKDSFELEGTAATLDLAIQYADNIRDSGLFIDVSIRELKLGVAVASGAPASPTQELLGGLAGQDPSSSLPAAKGIKFVLRATARPSPGEAEDETSE